MHARTHTYARTHTHTRAHKRIGIGADSNICQTTIDQQLWASEKEDNCSIALAATASLRNRITTLHALVSQVIALASRSDNGTH